MPNDTMVRVPPRAAYMGASKSRLIRTCSACSQPCVHFDPVRHRLLIVPRLALQVDTGAMQQVMIDCEVGAGATRGGAAVLLACAPRLRPAAFARRRASKTLMLLLLLVLHRHCAVRPVRSPPLV